MPRQDKALEELLKVAEQPEEERGLTKTERFLKTDSIVRFMGENGLESGNYKVAQSALYAYYAEFELNPLGEKTFHKRMKHYVRYENSHYYLNKDMYAISAPLHERLTSKRATVTPQHAASVLEFYKVHGLSRGNNYYHSYILFEIFQDWRAKHKKRRVPLKLFHAISKNICNEKRFYFRVMLGLNVKLEENPYTRDIALQLGKKYYEKKGTIPKKSKKIPGA